MDRLLLSIGGDTDNHVAPSEALRRGLEDVFLFDVPDDLEDQVVVFIHLRCEEESNDVLRRWYVALAARATTRSFLSVPSHTHIRTRNAHTGSLLFGKTRPLNRDGSVGSASVPRNLREVRRTIGW